MFLVIQKQKQKGWRKEIESILVSYITNDNGEPLNQKKKIWMGYCAWPRAQIDNVPPFDDSFRNSLLEDPFNFFSELRNFDARGVILVQGFICRGYSVNSLFSVSVRMWWQPLKVSMSFSYLQTVLQILQGKSHERSTII